MACCSKNTVRVIKVAEFEAGLAGLDQALRSVHASGLQDEKEIQKDLLRWIRESGNYVSPSREDDYKEALFREYRKYLETLAST